MTEEAYVQSRFHTRCSSAVRRGQSAYYPFLAVLAITANPCVVDQIALKLRPTTSIF